jgi:hypothetical protein
MMLVCAVAPSHAEKRVALVIGNGAYRYADKLVNPPSPSRSRLESKTILVVGGDIKDT